MVIYNRSPYDRLWKWIFESAGNCRRMGMNSRNPQLFRAGFGFDKLNCQRLDLPAIREARKENLPRFYANAYGLTAAEVRTAQSCTWPALEHWVAMLDGRNVALLRSCDLLR